MRHLAFATSLIGCLLTYHEANAQGFWYAPPGADLSAFSGIDLGNGLGFGYGFGVGYGSFESPCAAVEGAATDLWGSRNRSGGTTPQVRDNLADEFVGSIQDLQQRTAEYRAKQRVLKLDRAKARNQTIARSSATPDSQPSAGSQLRLSCGQFDRSTGKILWPQVLMQDSFSDERNQIESMLESLTQKGVTTDLSVQIARKTRELHDEFRKQIRAIPTKEFLKGHQFLERLELEGRLGWPTSDPGKCV